MASMSAGTWRTASLSNRLFVCCCLPADRSLDLEDVGVPGVLEPDLKFPLSRDVDLDLLWNVGFCSCAYLVLSSFALIIHNRVVLHVYPSFDFSRRDCCLHLSASMSVRESILGRSILACFAR